VASKKYIASEMLLEAVKKHQIHLAVLVAETGLWAHPDIHARCLRETGSAAMHPKVRRARGGETRGQTVNGTRLDDNTYANTAFKRALGFQRDEVRGFEVCHIWPRTCYDARYHTAIANLVLLPRALAGLSDHDLEIQESLQYRAYELYSWYPEGVPIPQKPSFYPSNWRPPESLPSSARSTSSYSRHPMTDLNTVIGEMSNEERLLVIRKIRKWASDPQLNVHRIISIVVQSSNDVSREYLVNETARITNSKNAYGAVASLLTSKANAYGRVFEDIDGIIRLHPSVEAEVRSFPWR
jgi:hypothetical protein